MAIKYIFTAIVGDAHKSDIFSVAVSSQFTITASADGFLRLWQNNDFDRKMELEQFVDKLGLHHVSTFEDTIDSKKVLLIAAVSFSGKLYLFSFDYNLKKLVRFESEADLLANKKISFWAPAFGKDPQSKTHYLIVTSVTGASHVLKMRFVINEEIEYPKPEFEYGGEIFSNDNTFATCVCVNVAERKVAVGHQNGNTYLYDLDHLMLLYNFESYGLKKNVSSNSLSIVRSIAFSPAGSLLAIARDSGPYGTVSLYDVKYGESVGSLTMPTHSSNVGIGSFAHNKWCLSVSFNDDGSLIATGGLDNKIRIWDVETRTSEATLTMSNTDVSDDVLESSNDLDTASCCSLSFIGKGVIKEEGENDGLVVVGFDRAVRWFREAGGI